MKVLPADWKSIPLFYYLSLKTLIDHFIFHKGFEHNEEVKDLIKVKIDGIIFNVRKSNFIYDIHHYLLRNEINVRKWFSFKKEKFL